MPMDYGVGHEITVEVIVTEDMVNKFAEVSGDRNPIHMDEEFAKTTRFGKRIAHGMLTAALISRVLAMELGPGGIYLSQTMKFLNPIFIDETVVIELKVLHVREEKGMASVSTIVKKKHNGDIVLKGEALIMAGGYV